MDRAQLTLSAIEAGVGVLLVLAVAASFGLALPSPHARRAQLDTNANDALTVLAQEAPRHGGATRLAEVSRSNASFDREHAALRHRVDRILPDNLLFRLRTPHGTVGYRRPTGVPIGRATVTTLHGEVVLWVWYV